MANFDGNYPYGNGQKGQYRKMTTSVGSFRPNGWGLYDMHGNVWEWCQDWYGDYPTGSVADPTGPGSGDTRVVRGGGWSNPASYARCAFRYGGPPAGRSSDFGVRVVVAPRP